MIRKRIFVAYCVIIKLQAAAYLGHLNKVDRQLNTSLSADSYKLNSAAGIIFYVNDKSRCANFNAQQPCPRSDVIRNTAKSSGKG